jgi:hypothetical protein
MGGGDEVAGEKRKKQTQQSNCGGGWRRLTSEVNDDLFEWKQCILLALIFHRGRSPRVEWKHSFQLALI